MIDRIDLGISVETKDVGATQVVSINIGGKRIGSWWAHTRHEDTALESAREAVIAALKPLIDAAMEEDGNTPVSPEHCPECGAYGRTEHEDWCSYA